MMTTHNRAAYSGLQPFNEYGSGTNRVSRLKASSGSKRNVVA